MAEMEIWPPGTWELSPKEKKEKKEQVRISKSEESSPEIEEAEYEEVRRRARVAIAERLL